MNRYVRPLKRGAARSSLNERFLDLAWWLRRAAVKLGFPGLVGLLLLSGAAWVHWVEMPRFARTLAALARDASEFSKPRVPTATTVKAAPLEVFRQQLEPQSRFTAVLDDINGTLKAANVTLIEATVARPKLKALPTVGRIDLTMYMRGSYATLKASLGTLLDRHPGLGLEQLTLEKSETANVALDAHARLVYYFRD